MANRSHLSLQFWKNSLIGNVLKPTIKHFLNPEINLLKCIVVIMLLIIIYQAFN